MVTLLTRPSAELVCTESTNEHGEKVFIPIGCVPNPVNVQSDESLQIGTEFKYNNHELYVNGVVESQLTDNTYRIKVNTFGS